MKNNWDLSDYETIKEIHLKKAGSFLFLFLTTVGIILIICKFHIEVYEKYTLIKNEDHFSMITESEKVPILEKNSILYIDNQKYHYTILNIEKDYTNINNIIYQTIYIDPYNYHTNAIITNCYLLRKRETIFEYLLEFIKGGSIWKE